MIENLIFDIGMHKSEDTDFYLHKGYKVVAIEADPDLIKRASLKYKDHIDKNQLVLLNYAVSDKDDEAVKFNIGQNTVWNSLKQSITTREENQAYTIEVKTKKLSTLMESFGIPYYCKIDIEGYDEIAVQTLHELKDLPPFISVETECIGKNEIISDEEALKTLNALYNLGYRNFKLIDQGSLVVLDENVKFYSNNRFTLRNLLIKLGFPVRNRDRLSREFKYQFVQGTSGPFGEETDKNWIDYEQAKRTLIRHRNDYFQLKRAKYYGFWCDWHAKK